MSSLVLIGLTLGACTSSDTQGGSASPSERIAAAIAAFEQAPQPPDIIASNVLASTVDEAGSVDLTLCTWDGVTAFDEVRRARYNTTLDSEGRVEARFVEGYSTLDECLNDTLLASALATIAAHDELWTAVLGDPAVFADNSVAPQLFTAESYAQLVTLTAGWAEEGIRYQGSPMQSPLPDSAATKLAWLRYSFDEREGFAIVACRDMDPTYGSYIGDELISNDRPVADAGQHSVTYYDLQPDPSTDLRWRIREVDGLVWGDCFQTGDWLGAVREWKPAPWELLAP